MKADKSPLPRTVAASTRVIRLRTVGNSLGERVRERGPQVGKIREAAGGFPSVSDREQNALRQRFEADLPTVGSNSENVPTHTDYIINAGT